MMSSYLTDHEVVTLDVVVKYLRSQGLPWHANKVQRIIDRYAELKICNKAAPFPEWNIQCQQSVGHDGDHKWTASYGRHIAARWFDE